MPTPPITHALAERHEALWLKLEALADHIRAVATKRPETPLDDITHHTAEGLLCDCRPFVGAGPGEKNRLPVAAPDHGGLMVQLGQARAKMEAFELRHSSWNVDLKAFVWELRQGGPLPVKRLRQQVVQMTEKRKIDIEDLREKLAKRIDALHQESADREAEERANTPVEVTWDEMFADEGPEESEQSHTYAPRLRRL